jgi:hypothetical protein
LGGVFIRPGLNPQLVRPAYELLISRAESLSLEHECISLSVISNPFSANDGHYREFLRPTFELENFTQWNNVDEPVPGMGYRSNLSRNVKKALAAGFEVKDCETPAELEAFYQVQCQRHTELGVAHFPFEFLERIQNLLVSRDKAKLLMVKKGEAIASTAIYLFHREVVDVLRLTINSEFINEAPNFLNTLESLRWAKERGMKVYNWQSAPNRASGVYRYKEQWGARESLYYTFTKIYCDASRMEAIGLETLRTDYALHFVVPYGVFQDGFSRREFRKD